MRKIGVPVIIAAVLFTIGCGRKIKSDLFTKYLDKREKNELVHRALTDRSYKNVNHNLTDNDINAELATYGDSIIKFQYSKLLWNEKVENITEAKKELESDKVFVTKVARHYDLLDYMYFDKNNSDMPKDYDYNGDSHKYIATAVEAMIAAIYLDTEELKPIRELLDSWREF